MTKDTEIQQHEVFLKAYEKAKKIKIAYTLEMDKELFKDYVRKAVNEILPQTSKWTVDETLEVEGRKIAFVVEGAYTVEERRWDARCNIEPFKISIIDSENNEYSFELTTEGDDLDFTIYDACQELSREYSISYTEAIKIKNTDR